MYENLREIIFPTPGGNDQNTVYLWSEFIRETIARSMHLLRLDYFSRMNSLPQEAPRN